MPKYELYNKKMHLTFIPLRSIKAGDFAVHGGFAAVNRGVDVVSTAIRCQIVHCSPTITGLYLFGGEKSK